MVILVESCQPSMSESIQNFGLWRALGKCKETCERHDERNCQTCLSVFRLIFYQDIPKKVERSKQRLMQEIKLDLNQKSGLKKKNADLVKKISSFWLEVSLRTLDTQLLWPFKEGGPIQISLGEQLFMALRSWYVYTIQHR